MRSQKIIQSSLDSKFSSYASTLCEAVIDPFNDLDIQAKSQLTQINSNLCQYNISSEQAYSFTLFDTYILDYYDNLLQRIEDLFNFKNFKELPFYELTTREISQCFDDSLLLNFILKKLIFVPPNINQMSSLEFVELHKECDINSCDYCAKQYYTQLIKSWGVPYNVPTQCITDHVLRCHSHNTCSFCQLMIANGWRF